MNPWYPRLLSLALLAAPACADGELPSTRSPVDPSNPNAPETPFFPGVPPLEALAGPGAPTAPALPPAHHPPAATSAAPAASVYVCPMHPEVVRDAPGTCPKCGMTLVLKPAAP